MASKPLLAALCLCSIALTDDAHSQEPKKRFRLYKKDLQVSLFPGISTNGIEVQRGQTATIEITIR